MASRSPREPKSIKNYAAPEIQLQQPQNGRCCACIRTTGFMCRSSSYQRHRSNRIRRPIMVLMGCSKPQIEKRRSNQR